MEILAVILALVAAFGQVLSKLALDSTVQQEIGEEIRTSAFAASETLNQLSWVAGGLLGVLLSLTNSGVAGGCGMPNDSTADANSPASHSVTPGASVAR